MAAYYKLKDLSLYDALINLFEKHGYYQEDLVSTTLKGIDGQEKIKNITKHLRKNSIEQINGQRVKVISDYLDGKVIDIKNRKIKPAKLPKSNILKYHLIDESWYQNRRIEKSGIRIF